MRKRVISKAFAILLTAVLSTSTATPVFASDYTDKEETVYVKTDSKGNEKTVIVSDWLKNFTGEKTIQDASDLKDIENVKGKESFSKEKNDKMTWEANGNDIYYQGTSDKELPISMNVTYYLDDKEIQPEKLIGKSGKIRIHYSYTNHSKVEKTIDGKRATIYTPFTMVTAAILNTDHFSNVKASNGKVISDGNKHIVIGIAMPGLSESLNLKNTSLGDAYDIPDDFEITADAKDFQMTVTATVATADTLSELGFDDMDSMDDLTSSLKDLEDAADKLENGSSELLTGVNKLASASKELKAGTAQLSKSSKELSGGLNKLADGSKELKNGTSQLASGTKKLPSSVAQLDSGVKEILKQLQNNMPSEKDQQTLQDNLTQAQTGITRELTNIKEKTQSIGGSAQGLGSIAFSLKDTAVSVGIQAATIGKLAAESKTLTSEEKAALARTAKALQEDASDLGNYAKSIGGSAQSIGADAASIGTSLKETQTDLEIVSGCLTQIQKLLTSTKTSTAKLEAALKQISAGTGQLLASSKRLSSSVNQLNNGASTLNNGLKTAANGGNQLSSGASALDQGTGKIVTGIASLQKGASTLNQGMITFNNEGIKKLVDTINGDLNETLDRAEAVVDAGKKYQTFTKKAESSKGSVKFMIETEELEK